MKTLRALLRILWWLPGAIIRDLRRPAAPPIKTRPEDLDYPEGPDSEASGTQEKES